MLVSCSMCEWISAVTDVRAPLKRKKKLFREELHEGDCGVCKMGVWGEGDGNFYYVQREIQ